MKFTPYFLALAVLVPKVASILENYAVFSEYRPWLQDMTNMPYPQWTSGRRAWGTVPKTCMDEATETGVCDPYEIYVYEIRYTDCDVPFQVCRCSNSITTDPIIDFARRLAKVPVRGRSWVRTWRTWQAYNNWQGSSLGEFIPQFLASPMHSRREFKCFVGTIFLEIDPNASVDAEVNLYEIYAKDWETISHELGHVLDYWVANGPTTRPMVRYSQTQRWINVAAMDSCVPNSYAKTNYGELFAEVVSQAMYEENIGPSPGNAACMSNMLTEVRTLLRPYFKYDATYRCNTRMTPSASVCMGPNARAQGACEGVPDNTGGALRVQSAASAMPGSQRGTVIGNPIRNRPRVGNATTEV